MICVKNTVCGMDKYCQDAMDSNAYTPSNQPGRLRCKSRSWHFKHLHSCQKLHTTVFFVLAKLVCYTTCFIFALIISKHCVEKKFSSKNMNSSIVKSLNFRSITRKTGNRLTPTKNLSITINLCV